MDSDITMRHVNGNDVISGDLSDPLFDPEKLRGINNSPDVVLIDDAPESEPTLPVPDKAWGKIYEIARVGPFGPVNREERRRVDKVLRRLEKRGLTLG